MESYIICVLGQSELYKQFQRTLMLTSPRQLSSETKEKHYAPLEASLMALCYRH